jgi:class 3 adenylate cyclase
MSTKKFEKDTVYDNVFLVFIDTAGYSNIVKNNPKDLSKNAFDLVYETIERRLVRTCRDKRCEIGTIWSWLGDGGTIAIYDSEERIALNTTLDFVQNVLRADLIALKEEFEIQKINGELHVRIAVHKGTITYTDDGQQGFIHSSAINWGSHLEKATPKDSVSISREIYDIMSNQKKSEFTCVGRYEDEEVFIFSLNTDKALRKLNWIALHGFENVEFPQCYIERISERDKANLIIQAKNRVIDFGTTLNTCSNYLFSNSRPATYKTAVLDLLSRGGSFCCYMLEPNSPGSKQLAELRQEDTDKKLRDSIARFKEFKSRNTSNIEYFSVYQFAENPNFAALIIDPDSDHAVCLYSPYLNGLQKDGERKGRADMPHYLISKKNSRIFDYIWNYVLDYMNISEKVL